MQETWKFHIDPQSGQSDESMIRDLIRESKEEMGIFLSYYFKKDGAVVENVEIDGEVTTREPRHGKFRVVFDLIHYNACLNIHDQNIDRMDLEYSREKDQVIFTGPYWPERGQDEI